MKILFPLLLLLSSARLSYWQSEISSENQLCARIEALNKQPRARGARLKVIARVIESFKGQNEFRVEKIRFLNQNAPFHSGLNVPVEIAKRIQSQNLVLFQGKVHCEDLLKNFGVTQDGPFRKMTRKININRTHLDWKVISPELRTSVNLGDVFRRWLNLTFRPYPSFHGVVWAVWTGGTQGLNSDIVQLYREGGLLPLVALSGQHVSVLVFLFRAVIQFFAKPFLGRRPFRAFYKYLDLFLPMIAALLLAITSDFVPSILRTLAMALAVVLLRVRKCLSAAPQILSVSSGLLILWDPALINGVGFVLSVAGTYLILDVSSQVGSGSSIKKYFLFSLLMPVLLLPFILFYFGQWSYLNPLCQVAISWLWVLFLIPLGFLAPLLGTLPSGIRETVCVFLDLIIHKLNSVEIQSLEIIHSSYLSLPKLTWFEVILLEGLLLKLTYWVKQRNDVAAMRIF